MINLKHFVSACIVFHNPLALRTLMENQRNFLVERANAIYIEAKAAFEAKKYKMAKKLVKISLHLNKTPEAYMISGLLYAHFNQFERAIKETMQAIHLNPELGPAYNDIGYFLESSGQREEALEWFTLAKEAKIQPNPHFPYLNKGLIYLFQGNGLMALNEFQEAKLKANHQEVIYECDILINKAKLVCVK